MVKVLITGICGFVGSVLAREIRKYFEDIQVVGLDNLSRSGSETNLRPLRDDQIDARVGDIRKYDDLDQFGEVDWVIDAAANPSVLAGIDGKTSAMELMDQNLFGTIKLLEFCRKCDATFTLISTSRVYSIRKLKSLPLEIHDRAFQLAGSSGIDGVSQYGIRESFSTDSPISLYGVSKFCAEKIALEYGELYRFPVWINRCGVMAGAGQFGTAEQGIFSYWIRSWKAKRPVQYIGFGGTGFQVRDCLSPRDTLPLLASQFSCSRTDDRPPIVNVSGGIESALSLAQLSDYCQSRFGSNVVTAEPTDRPYDVPWMVLDSSLANQLWGWTPTTSVNEILDEIAAANLSV